VGRAKREDEAGTDDHRGIVDGQTELTGRLDEISAASDPDCFRQVFGEGDTGTIVLRDGSDRELIRAPLIKLAAADNSTFRAVQRKDRKALSLGRTEEQTFQGDLILRLREDGTITAINEIPLESYLESVVSSEMNGALPWNS